jgi:hypothetical protein
MARKSFTINTEPHVATVGDLELEFKPEVIGGEFLEAYGELREAQSVLSEGKPGELSAEQARDVHKAMREFLAGFMLPHSAEAFSAVSLPDRILVQLLEWISEVYGGGSTARPTGRSSGSAARPKRSGNPGSDHS